MKKAFLVILSGLVFLLVFNSWTPRIFSDGGTGAEDSTDLARGEAAFNQYCSGCHNFRQDGIGPQLGGLSGKVPAGWIQQFIRNPQKVISSGNKRAQQLFKKYKVVMPSFPNLGQRDVNGIVAYISRQKAPEALLSKGMGILATNPVPEAIPISGLVAGLQLITVIPPSADSGKMPLTRISKLDFEPGSHQLFILDQRGKMYRLQGNKPEVYMDMSQLKSHFIGVPGLATGFGSFAFHPDFLKNGLLYTTHTETAGSAKADFGFADTIKVALQWVLTEWKVDDPNSDQFSGTARELLRVNMVSAIHGIQEITFNPLATPGNEDYGLLYIGVGEGGCVEHGYPTLAHSLEKVWGTILRIDPAGNNSSNKQYGIPVHNPFAANKNPAVLREIYAYGFRNPHRITWSKTGKMLVGNVGHGNIESVNLVLPGRDYGWPIREGTFAVDPYGDLNKVYLLPSNDSIYKVTYPVAQYDHDEGKAISGGFEYTGSAVPLLKGKYLFGDIPSGRLFYIDMAAIKQGQQAKIREWQMSLDGRITSFRDIIGNGRIDLHFGKDAQGELYVMTKADGKVYRLVTGVMKATNAIK